MSTHSAKGSVVLKILILLCLVLLFAVIKIPDMIWQEEALEQKTARENITSIYEAEKFFYRTNKNYTTDPADLIRFVRSDSSLIKMQKVVNYTQELKGVIGNYLGIPYVNALKIIDENARSIIEDFEVNARYLRVDENIKNEAEDLKIRLAGINSDIEFEFYSKGAKYIDSLSQINRDLSDLTLQTASARSAAITDSLNAILPKIEREKLKNTWGPLVPRFETFVRNVMYSEAVRTSTNVHDRVDEFKDRISKAFADIEKLDINKNIESAKNINTELRMLYQKFLKDFLITSRAAQFRLTEEDSMILHLTEDNFYSPVKGRTDLQYKILIDPDSLSVKVESPILLKELQERAKPIVDNVSTLEFIPHFKAYMDTVDGIMTKAVDIKQKLRKNTDIFIKNKEIEEVVKKIPNISEFEAYETLHNLAEKGGISESYSDIQMYLEDGLNGVRIFSKIYSEKFFPNLDSLTKDLVRHLKEYNDILGNVKRLPKDIIHFEKEIIALENTLNQIKQVPTDIVEQKLKPIEKDIADVLVYAAEGETERMYGVFFKKVVNFGYIHKDFKSWEEEK